LQLLLLPTVADIPQARRVGGSFGFAAIAAIADIADIADSGLQACQQHNSLIFFEYFITC
jgi:hypothetical protein